MSAGLKRIRRVAGAVCLGTILGVTAGSFASSKAPSQAKTYAQLLLFADVLGRVERNYVEPIEDDSLITYALNGALQSLDPHSRYVPPEEFQSSQKKSRREYGGLGIEISMEDGLVKIGYANRNSPAERAGLKADDLITHIEGNPILGQTLDEAVEDMRGLAGDSITITIKTEGQPARDVTIVREVIMGRAVRHRMYEGIGYIYLETFNNQNVTDDLEEALKLLEAENGAPLPGLILDIRNNGGGLLLQSVSIAGQFLDGGEVVSIRGRRAGDNERYHAKQGQTLAGIPLIVLINNNSASASEIVAGALQDRGRALIVGTQSFGKGSVQSVYPIGPDMKGALRLTTARYFTPSGRSIQGLGITPDIWVESHPDDGRKRLSIREATLPNSLDAIILETEATAKDRKQPDHEFAPADWPKDKDYQLDRAVEIIKSPDYQSRLAEAFGN